jgi:hypothetical protein
MSIEAVVRTQWILWGALTSSLGIYFVLANVLATAPGAAPVEPVLVYALGGVAATLFALIPIVRGKMLPPMRAPASLGEALPTMNGPSPALAKLQAALIVSWAMCEAIAIFGLVLVVLSHQTRYFFYFAPLALVGMVLYRPSVDRAAEVLRAEQHT